MEIGLIGCGYWGEKHINILSNLKFIEKIHLCDIDKNKLTKYRGNTRFETYSNYKDIIKLNNVYCIFVITPNKTHYEIAKSCLLNQKNIFVEKPLCSNLEQAKSLIYIANKSNLSLFCGYTYLFDNCIKEISNLINQNDILEIKFQWLSKLTNILEDVSIIDDLGIHPLSILYNLLGSDPSIQEFNIMNKDKKDQSANILLDYGHIKTKIALSWISPIKKRNISINTNQKSLEIDCIAQKIIINNNSTVKEIIYKNDTQPLTEEVKYFLSHIKNKTPIPSYHQKLNISMYQLLDRFK